MIGYSFFLFKRNDFVFSFPDAHDPVNRIRKSCLSTIVLFFLAAISAASLQTLAISAPEKAGSLFCQETYVKILLDLYWPQMHPEDSIPLLEIGKFHMYLAVKSSCTEQCPVKYICTVCGCQNNHTHICSKPSISVRSWLRVFFAFIVSSEVRIPAASPADCINFIDEYDAGSLLLGLLEKIFTLMLLHQRTSQPKSDPDIEKKGTFPLRPQLLPAKFYLFPEAPQAGLL